MKYLKLGRVRVALLTFGVVAVLMISFKWWRHSSELTLIKSTVPILATGRYSKGVASKITTRGSVVVIQTGDERMSNAVRCMSYVADLSNKLPAERASDKRILMAWAGVLFFGDCLMAKISNGYISITTNELRQNFSNAVSQLFTNTVPSDLVAGFNHSFSDRNNLHTTVDEQYQRMAKFPELARTLNALDSALQQAGVTDASQSDLKEILLALGDTRTSAYLIYGPQSDVPVPLEYQAMADSLEKILHWRLVNMYGLDDASAQTLIQAVSKIPVTSFSHAGMQVPAFIR